MATPVSILSIASFSALGSTPADVWQNYLSDTTLIKQMHIGNSLVPSAPISAELATQVQALRDSNTKYRQLDPSVLYAMIASRAAVKAAGWGEGDTFGINIGSSRGATYLFEQHHAEFLETGRSGTQASPATTLGNISSWVAHDLNSSGPDISHSITCSTALHALLNGVAWLRSGMADKFLTGGSEAPLTPFTLSQMKAMKIYSADDSDYPCRALDLDKTKNAMVLGEGAASASLELGRKPNAIAYIEGIGYATELLQHSVSISAEADCLQKSMLMALQDTEFNDVDAIVMHAPGTVKGDLSEYAAVQKIFGESLPLLTTTKWKNGHTFGPSGLLSLELAVLMLQHGEFIGVPYLSGGSHVKKKAIKKILVNAVGFGGNAVSVLVSK
ncbi:MAG: beta-ketoacyl synthase [Sphingobacteriales bacterium]|nr:MAG: beta-ketoacyl synthase [Sphingobacteriales bacterium]